MLCRSIASAIILIFLAGQIAVAQYVFSDKKTTLPAAESSRAIIDSLEEIASTIALDSSLAAGRDSAASAAADSVAAPDNPDSLAGLAAEDTILLLAQAADTGAKPDSFQAVIAPAEKPTASIISRIKVFVKSGLPIKWLAKLKNPGRGDSSAALENSRVSSRPPAPPRVAEYARAIQFRYHIIFLLISLVILTLAALFFFKSRDSKRFLTTTRLSVVDKEVQRACNYVEKNYSDPGLSADVISEKLVTGTAFLQTLFARELGMSVEDFIEQVRMNRIRIMLGENPEIPSDELAAQTGCSDVRAMSETFLKNTGVSIDEYRAHV